MPDNGEALDGTKDSTADDFLSWGEFRYFNIYICVYAAMYDAFAKIDGATGGGADNGRDGDDLRMETDEWLAGYKRVADIYGFQGLTSDKLGDDAAAMKVFGEIDDNGALTKRAEVLEWPGRAPPPAPPPTPTTHPLPSPICFHILPPPRAQPPHHTPPTPSSPSCPRRRYCADGRVVGVH